MPETLSNRLPPIVFEEKSMRRLRGVRKSFYANRSPYHFEKVSAAFGIALHMHQPTIPASNADLSSAELISNLRYMMEHQEIHDNHNAPVFFQCYQRMADLIAQLVDRGKNPRIMLDYSGNLLWALSEMENGRAIEKLRTIASQAKYQPHVEWLGTMWSHAVVSSTPVPDIDLHMKAWLQHFANLFGEEACQRVKGFSAPEMHLPIDPDVCYEYVRALRENGYEWLLVQEHTIQQPDGKPIQRPNYPHRLVAKNSSGQTAEIIVLIKTQGSDTKLVGQMQPYYEAKSKTPQDYQGKVLSPYVVQIGDGENGGVMMNEFPPAYFKAFEEIGSNPEGTVAMNGSEYLEFVQETGLKTSDFLPVQPIMQNHIWEFFSGRGRADMEKAILASQKKYPGFHLEKASWTNNLNWIEGYENVLDPMRRLSAEFHKKFDQQAAPSPNSYHQALLYLLLSQTSCFRYWGQGIWTQYAQEICRRGMQVLQAVYSATPRRGGASQQ